MELIVEEHNGQVEISEKKRIAFATQFPHVRDIVLALNDNRVVVKVNQNVGPRRSGSQLPVRLHWGGNTSSSSTMVDGTIGPHLYAAALATNNDKTVNNIIV